MECEECEECKGFVLVLYIAVVLWCVVMYGEIQEAVCFLCSFLYNKVPRRKVDLFAEQLANNLLAKYCGHWDISEPHREACYRCIEVNVQGKSEPLMSSACSSVGLDMDELLAYLPSELSIWVNPGDVSYRIGSSNSQPFLSASYKQQDLAHKPKLMLKTVPAPGGDNEASRVFELMPADGCVYTVGTFAMTRFGSTKLKSSPVTLRQTRAHSPQPTAVWPSYGYRFGAGCTLFQPVHYPPPMRCWPEQ